MPTNTDQPDFPAWRRGLAYVTVAAMPLAFNVEKTFHFKDKHYLSPLYLLLPVLVLLLLYDLWRDRMRFPIVSFRTPPLASVLWATLAVVSCLWTEEFPSNDTFRDWRFGIQASVVFGLAAVWVFENIAHEPAEYRRLALILGGSVAVCLLLALRQYMGPPGLPFDPANKGQDLGGVTNIRLGGWYEYRGILGAQVALIAPAAAAFAVLDRDSAVRAIAFGVAALSLFVTLSAGGFFRSRGWDRCRGRCAFSLPWKESRGACGIDVSRCCDYGAHKVAAKQFEDTTSRCVALRGRERTENSVGAAQALPGSARFAWIAVKSQ